jgi:hypothetical protein
MRRPCSRRIASRGRLAAQPIGPYPRPAHPCMVAARY